MNRPERSDRGHGFAALLGAVGAGFAFITGHAAVALDAAGAERREIAAFGLGLLFTVGIGAVIVAGVLSDG